MKRGANRDAVKKVCSAKDDAPIGEVVYEKDGYAIHKIDGEEHKVRTNAKHSSKLLVTQTNFLPAVRPKPLPLRQTLPRHQVRLLRRLLLPLLPPGATPLALPAKQQRRPSNTTTPEPSRRLLQQRENELGQQQSSLYSRLSALATQRSRPAAHGRFIRAGSARRTFRWTREAA